MPYGVAMRPMHVTAEEAAELRSWLRRPTPAQALALRARIVLAADRGESSTSIARRLGIALPTVGKWRRRFVERRLEGLLDEPRPGAPRTTGNSARRSRRVERRPACVGSSRADHAAPAAGS